MQVNLGGKVSIVTGMGVLGEGKTGIGSAIALMLAQNGSDVAVFDVMEAYAQAVANEIEKMGRKTLALAVDVTSSAQVNDAVQKVIGKFGKIDVLVANAGIIERTAPINLWELEEKDFDAVYAVNVKGVYNCCKAVIPYLIPQRSGRIILTSSMVSKQTFPGLTCYSSSKWAVNGMTQGLALELGQYDITVNAVAPGIVYTSIWEYLSNTFGEINNQDPVAAFKTYTNTIPLGRPQTAEDLANMVTFVASDEAKNITGQVMAVCGGKTPI